MLVQINACAPGFALKFRGSDEISLSSLCATEAEAIGMQAEARKIGREARIVPVVVTVTENNDPNARHGGRL